MFFVFFFVFSTDSLHSQDEFAAFIDFEDLAPGIAVHRQYAGVTFVGGDAFPPRYSIVRPQHGTVSGGNALQAAARGEFEGSHLRMTFDEPQRRVKLSVGLIDNGVGLDDLLVVFRGYSTRNPSRAEIDNPTVLCCTVFLGSPPQPVETPLELWSAESEIVMAMVSIICVGCVPLSPDRVVIAIDNLEFNRPDSPRLPDRVAPVIDVSNPREGEILVGAVAGATEARIEGRIFEEDLQSLTISVNGRTPQFVGFQPHADGEYDFFRHLFAGDGIEGGLNELSVTARDFDQNETTLNRRFFYQIKPVPPPSITDIVPVAVEVNQGISEGPVAPLRSEPDGTYSISFPQAVTLVEKTPTLVRVYAVAENSTERVLRVPARMLVYRDDCEEDCLLGELEPGKATLPQYRFATLEPAGSLEASLHELSKNLLATWNFAIPGAWTTQDLRLVVDVNFASQIVPECEARFLGECERDNRVTIQVSFRPQKVVTVNPIVVWQRGEFEGAWVDDFPENDPDARSERIERVGDMFGELNLLYPTRFELGPIRTITVSPEITDSELLVRVQEEFGCVAPSIDPSTWWACGYDPSQFNVALVKARTSPSGPGDNLSWGGLANRGNNTVWATEGSFSTPAHEVGHAIGFKHATCDHDESSGGSCDSFFPFEHGTIGGIGFRMSTWDLFAEDGTHGGQGSASFHDFMSYGSNRWISQFMWELTAEHTTTGSIDYAVCWDASGRVRVCGVSQASANTLPAAEGPVYLVRGSILVDGSAELHDAYMLPRGGRARSIEALKQYRLQGVDARGNTLTTRRVYPRASAADGGALGGVDVGWSFVAELESPKDGRLSRIELLEDDRVIGTLRSRANSVPDITIESLGGPGIWRRGERRRVSWRISQPADPALFSARVEYLPGREESGLVLGSQIRDPFLDVTVDNLPASEDGRIVVRLSDGVQTRTVMSAPIVVEETRPNVLIISPDSDIRVESNSPVELYGLASGDRTSLSGDALFWSSDLDGDLGTGSRIVVASLSAGRHTISLRATATNGLTSSDTIVLIVGGESFRRGDCNDDRTVDLSDAIFNLSSLFLGQGDPRCADSCDTNDDGSLDISDAIMTLGVLFLGNGDIPAPGVAGCGSDLTEDELGCEGFGSCVTGK